MSSYQGKLKKDTAKDVTILLIDSSDHITGKTGLAAGLTIYATKAAGTPAAITPTVTELDSTNVKGLYKLALTSGHTDTLGEFQLHITGSGADPADYKWEISTRLLDDLAFPNTSGRGIDVETTGEVGLDFNNINDASGAHTLTNITVPIVTSVTNRVTANTDQIEGADATDTLDARVQAGLTAQGYTTTRAGYIDTLNGLVQAIWDKATSALTTASSIGKLLVDNIDATISSRLATASYTAPDNASITAIKAKTDNLPSSPAATGDAMTLTAGERTSIADAILKRDWTAVTGAASRSVLNALRFLRNKWSITSTTMTVTEEDDTTTAWTASLSTTPGADPVTGSDPS